MVDLNEHRIKEIITQLDILVTKQEGYGMSFSDTHNNHSINLYGDRAKSAIWLFKNASNISDTLTTLLQERKNDHENINLKADFIDATINDLAQKDKDIQELRDSLICPLEELPDVIDVVLCKALHGRGLSKDKAKHIYSSITEEHRNMLSNIFIREANALISEVQRS